MAILAAIDMSDSSLDVERKIKIVSYYIDYFATMRIINNKDNNYDNIRDYIFSLCLRIRRKSVGELVEILAKEMGVLEDKSKGLLNVTYGSTKNKNLLHLLARFASFLEDGVEQTNRVGFAGYVDRNKGARTFDVEHVIPNKIADVQNDLGPEYDFTLREFSRERDFLGGLILLPRGRNRSLKDMVYTKKVPKYAGENILAQTLTESFYDNNPQVSSFKSQFLLEDLAPVTAFNKSAIDRRTRLYIRLADLIWNDKNLRSLAN